MSVKYLFEKYNPKLYKIYKEALTSESKQFKVSLIAINRFDHSSLLTFKDIPFTIIWQDDVHYAKFKVLDDEWLSRNPEFTNINELICLTGREFDDVVEHENYFFYWGINLREAFELLMQVELHTIEDHNFSIEDTLNQINMHLETISLICNLKLNDFKVDELEKRKEINLKEIQKLTKENLVKIKQRQETQINNFLVQEITKAAKNGLFEIKIYQKDLSKFKQDIVKEVIEKLKEKGFCVIPYYTCKLCDKVLDQYLISWN